MCNQMMNHLDLFVHMFGQSFFNMDKFPHDETMHKFDKLRNIDML